MYATPSSYKVFARPPAPLPLQAHTVLGPPLFSSIFVVDAASPVTLKISGKVYMV